MMVIKVFLVANVVPNQLFPNSLIWPLKPAPNSPPSKTVNHIPLVKHSKKLPFSVINVITNIIPIISIQMAM